METYASLCFIIVSPKFTTSYSGYYERVSYENWKLNIVASAIIIFAIMMYRSGVSMVSSGLL